ncbi:hypothetical protein BJV74DRAFT_825040 [Russula compacta]|nr:hypothetical protein BJV74DRAFT_825040 [Russula compacta]
MSEYPRITYQSSGRTFDRLFKEQSLDEMRSVVRKKLGLSHDAPIELAQLRDGRRVDLEDDDDFEAFMALIKFSIHATVAVTIPENGRSSSIPAPAERHTLAEGKGHPTSSHSEPSTPEAVHSDTVMPVAMDPLVRLPTTHVTSTDPPRKRRKVAVNGNLVTSVATQPQPSQQHASKDDSPSLSREVPHIVVHKPTSGAVVPLRSASQTEKVGPSTQTQAKEPGKHKRKAAKITPSEASPADLAETSAETSRKKKKSKKGASLGMGTPPEQGALNSRNVDMSSDKRFRRNQMVVSEIPTST